MGVWVKISKCSTNNDWDHIAILNFADNAGGTAKRRKRNAGSAPYNQEVAINSYFNTETKELTVDKFCTDISDNCQNVVKNFDGTDWKFFDDMIVDFQKREKCIKLTRDNTIAVTGCDEINHMVCRLDCCKCFV